ncbi:MAG: crossover junction endodeoxyribonuclease RuvC [Verrucomicrobiota bacterium]
MRVIGIDASLRSTGLAVVDSSGGRMAAVEHDTVRNSADLPHSECLRHVQEGVAAVLARCKPQAAAIEGGFYFKNARTAMILGEVRGVVIAACASAGVPVYEYSPRDAKKALTGFGGAQKDQVAKMVMSILGLEEKPQEDAADALAIAICHLQSQTGIAALRAEPI